MGVVSRGSPPGPVIVKGLADVTVRSLCIVFAVAHQFAVFILHTLVGMTVTLAPGWEGECNGSGAQ